MRDARTDFDPKPKDLLVEDDRISAIEPMGTIGDADQIIKADGMGREPADGIDDAVFATRKTATVDRPSGLPPHHGGRDRVVTDRCDHRC